MIFLQIVLSCQSPFVLQGFRFIFLVLYWQIMHFGHITPVHMVYLFCWMVEHSILCYWKTNFTECECLICLIRRRWLSQGCSLPWVIGTQIINTTKYKYCLLYSYKFPPLTNIEAGILLDFLCTIQQEILTDNSDHIMPD